MIVGHCEWNHRGVIVESSTLASRAWSWRTQRAGDADAGLYCSSCAADIMAKALNPGFGGRGKKVGKPETESPGPGYRTTSRGSRSGADFTPASDPRLNVDCGQHDRRQLLPGQPPADFTLAK